MIAIYQMRRDAETLKEVPTGDFERSTFRDPDWITWIDLADPTAAEEQAVLTELGGFHSLSIDDCRSPMHHPKLDEFSEYLFVIIHGVRMLERGTNFDTVKISAFLGPNYLVSYHREPIESVSKTAAHCLANPRAFRRGPDNIFHHIIDDMVDAYLPVLNRMDDTIDDLGDEIFRDPSNSILFRILELKKDIMRLRRVATYQKEVLNRLSRGEFDLITQEERIYYRDVYDHLVRITDLSETYRDLISGTLDAYLSVISNRMNEVMKTLTIIATIMLPLSLIAGIYGMNFKFMPELEWPYGYAAAIGLMLVLAGGMLLYFRKRKWF